MRTNAIVILGALICGAPVHALNQSKHYDISLAACSDAGLPRAFCQRVGVETYDVDAREFDDLSAHAQVPNGSTACDAANNSLWREFWLGGQIRAVTIGIGYSPSRAQNNLLAQHLGRALHTVQDNCAHSGMPNPQHAWHSLSDVCHGTTESPDVVPAAADCAAAESEALFSAFTDVLADHGGEFASLSDVSSDEKHYPAYAAVCDFLASASDWDGSDRRWNNEVMRPALTTQLLAGLGGADDSQFARVCTSYSDDVSDLASDPDRDTSGGAQSCLKIHAFCLGKADAAGEATMPPPWETSPEPSATVQGGCSTVGDSGRAASPLGGLLLVALLLGLCLRRGLL